MNRQALLIAILAAIFAALSWTANAAKFIELDPFERF